MRFKTLSLYFLVFGIIACIQLPSARGELVLVVDTSAETFQLSGMDSGTLFDAGGRGAVQWQWSNKGGSGAGSIVEGPPTSTLFTSSLGASESRIVTDTLSGGRFVLLLYTDTPGSGNIIGANKTLSYSSWDSGAKARMESLIGTTSEQLFFASGFQPLSLSAVPEPTSFAMFGMAMMGMARRRRIKKVSGTFN